ncbi:hypothetical protein H1R20_g7252, partial [Candolleomyces eurysporus]
MQTGFQQPNQPQFQQQQPPQFQQQFGGQVPQQQFGQTLQPQFQGQQGPAFTGMGGGLAPQATGFPAQQQRQLQAQATGFPGLQPQATGFVGGGAFQQQQRAPPPPPPVPPMPPMPPLPAQFQGQQSQLQPQQGPNRFMSASPGLVPQRTGFPAAAPLVAQPTGFVDPRLQMLSQSFMPVNTSSPYTPAGLPQLAPQTNLIQSFQQHNQDVRGQATQQMSWALSKAEKKKYDGIFRSWDTKGTGFIDGSTALEVFGASGLPQNELAQVWQLADVDDRGKLNIAEFHTAMGLIYRRLNGNPMPSELPPELKPPSAEDSVEFMKTLLRNEPRANSPRNDNFNSSRKPQGRDALIYKHNDSEPAGGVYRSSKRHVDREAVRRTGDDSPSSDLSDIKRQLASTANMLDRATEEEALRTREDEELDQELADLKYRVTRVQDDLDYNRRSAKSTKREEERRRLERELLTLMHEKIPDVERRVKAREERKEREKRERLRARDDANDRFGRYGGVNRDEDRRRYDDYDRDRPSSRNYDSPGRAAWCT